MVIYGASGHAKVIIDIINSKDGESVDFIVDDDIAIEKLLEFKVDHSFLKQMDDQQVVLAIGNNDIRKKLTSNIRQFCEPLIHKNAEVSEFAILGRGTVVMAKAIVNASALIGKHCIVNSGAIVEHDVHLNDFVHISPGAIVTGNVEIGEGTHVGAGAVIIPGIKIGRWVTIGAGAVIINDIPDFSVVVGNPGKIIKVNKIKDEQQ